MMWASEPGTPKHYICQRSIEHQQSPIKTCSIWKEWFFNKQTNCLWQLHFPVFSKLNYSKTYKPTSTKCCMICWIIIRIDFCLFDVCCMHQQPQVKLLRTRSIHQGSEYGCNVSFHNHLACRSRSWSRLRDRRLFSPRRSSNKITCKWY